MDYLTESFHSVGKAIQILSLRYINICLPMRPCYAYDFLGVHQDEGKIDRIKVIRTDYTSPSGSYQVNLRKSGGYSKSNTQKAPFDPKCCDILFIDSPCGEYIIPTSVITQKRAISLSMFPGYRYSELAQR